MSEDLKIIKDRIYEEDRVEFILQELGCGHIKKEGFGKMWVSSLPDGDNKRSVQIKNNPSLTLHIRSKGITGDIFMLVGYILYNCTTFEQLTKKLFECKKWICQTLEWEEYLSHSSKKKSEKHDWNSWLRDIKNKRKKKNKKNVHNEIISNTIRDEKILKEFGNLPHIQWVNEGIKPSTQIAFGVGYDMLTHRITFPIHNKDGQLIGVKGRYVGTNEATMKDKKYMFLYKCNKSIENFNYHRALSHINEKKEVLVFEGEKSVMLATQYGYPWSISVMGSEISHEQAQMIKQTGLDVKIILCYDKDKNSDDLRKYAEVFGNRRIYAMYDWKKGEVDLLTDKDSPVDLGKDVFDKLYNERIYRIRG